MWWRILFLFWCGCSPTSFGWIMDEPYLYAFKISMNSNAGHINFDLNGYLSMKWKTLEKLSGHIENSSNDSSVTRRPFEATFKEGQVAELKVSPLASKFDIEFVRGILSHLQVSDLIHSHEKFSIMEKSVSGECETYYEALDSKNILKRKNFQNCTKIPHFRRGVCGNKYLDKILEEQKNTLNRTIITEIMVNEKSEIRQVRSVEQFKIQSGKDPVIFSTEVFLQKIQADKNDSYPDEKFISVGDLMYQPKPLKFCNRNRCSRNIEHSHSCIADSYINTHCFSSSYPHSTANFNISKALVEQISQELVNPSEIPKTNTLDRFTVLIGLIRRMKITELEKISHSWGNDTRETFIFQTSLTLAGTFDSLLMIISLKKNGGLRNELRTLRQLPCMIHPLTSEYLDMLFDFATDPELMKDDFEFATRLIFDFSHLLRRYRTREEKPFDIKQLKRLVVKKYRPYFLGILKESLNKEDDVEFEKYVVAVGIMADLPLFKYLLSFPPGVLSPMKKTFTIYQMNETIELYPDESRLQLLKLYDNPNEAAIVRIAAVHQLFKTDMPNDAVLDVLRVAKDSGSTEIQNLVKSTAMSHDYSYYLNEETRKLADTINPNGTLETHTRQPIAITKTHQLSIIEYIKNLYENPLALFCPEKTGGLINDVDRFMRNLASPTTSHSRYPITMDLYQKLRSASSFLNMDCNFKSLLILTKKLSPDVSDFENLKDESGIESILSLSEIEIGFPTEIGFPFVYSFQSPFFLHYNVSNPVKDENTFTKNIHLTSSKRKQIKIGIINPMDEKYHFFGVDINEQLNIPIIFSYNFTRDENFDEDFASITPLFKDENQRILHFSTWPYSAKRDILPLVPTAEEKNVEMIMSDKILTAQEYLDDSERFLVQVTSSKINSTGKASDFFPELNMYGSYGSFEEIFLPHNQFDFFFKEDKKAPTWLIFKFYSEENETISTLRKELYGKGPFLFDRMYSFRKMVKLTGRTNRSMILETRQEMGTFSFFKPAMKFSVEGTYFENATVVHEDCFDFVVGHLESRNYEKRNNSIYAQLKFGKSCASGGLIALETEIDPQVLLSYTDMNFTIDFTDVANETAAKICKLSEEKYLKLGNRNTKFIQKNEEKCKEFRNQNNEKS